MDEMSRKTNPDAPAQPVEREMIPSDHASFFCPGNSRNGLDGRLTGRNQSSVVLRRGRSYLSALIRVCVREKSRQHF